ncbi:response regulator, partial [Candidatus Margulisiibacteriota bacterium]
MSKKTILLITDSHKTENSVREALGKSYHLESARGGKAAAELLAKKSADLIIIDFDVKGEDGLRIFRSLGTAAKTIMLSAAGSIPLAVSAAKLGIAEFLRKPVNAEQLREAVAKHIAKEVPSLRWPQGLEWLRGGSPGLQAMLAAIQAVLAEKRDVVLVGEPGVPKAQVAEFIHQNGPRKGRKFVKVDAGSFRRESFENHFWATVQELMSLPEAGSIQAEEDRCGTLYLDNVENLDDHFLLSILNFFQERSGKIDKSIQVIIGVSRRGALAADRYVWLDIP